MDPLISVVIPIYKVEKYLRQCIESVLKQTFQNLEIILVDDGSPDSCGKICDEYAEKDARVLVIHKENGGISDARNAGIDAATGKYILFIDGDDFVLKDYVEYLYQLLREKEADLSGCQWIDVNEEGEILKKKQASLDKTLLGRKACMECYLSEKGLYTAPWGKLYKTDMFHSVRYPKGKYCEDVFTTYQLIAQCEKIAVGSGQKYAYRSRRESATKSTFSIRHLDSIEGTIQRSEFVNTIYPELGVLARSKIIYAVNACALKMLRAEVLDPKILTNLQEKYRKYEKDFLRGASGWKAKAFSLAAFFNLPFFMRTVLCLKKIGKELGICGGKIGEI